MGGKTQVLTSQLEHHSFQVENNKYFKVGKAFCVRKRKVGPFLGRKGHIWVGESFFRSVKTILGRKSLVLGRELVFVRSRSWLLGKKKDLIFM